MEAHHPEHATGFRLHGDERHGAGVIDLGKARHVCVAKILHRGKESQPQVFLGDVLKKRAIKTFILRPNRTQEHAHAVPENEMPFPLLRIGPNRKSRMTTPASRARCERRY